MSAYRIYKTSKANPILLFLVLALFIFGFVVIVKGIFGFLALLTPLMLIAAVILNYRVIFGYGKWLLQTTRTNPVFGIISIAFTVIAFPFVAAYLLAKAIGSREKSTSSPTKKLGQYIQYEEVDEDFLDLSDVKSKKKDIEDTYSNLIK